MITQSAQSGGRWKHLDVAMQAGGNLRMWNGYCNGDELVVLSGQIIVIAYPCMVGVNMKIHKFDIITMGGNVGGV